MPVIPPRQAYLSAALAAAAVAVAAPLNSPAAPPDAVTASAPHPVLRPVPVVTVTAIPQAPASRTSDDTESSTLAPSPAAKPPAPPTRTVRAVAAVPSPHYPALPSSSGAYGSPRAYAESLVGAAQFACLDPLWDRESGWNLYAENPSSGAYGIPQALPGSKMASAGPDWRTDADTQVRWGVSYVDAMYGSPCGAWAHEQAQGWY